MKKGSVPGMIDSATQPIGPEQKFELGLAMIRSLPNNLRQGTAQRLLSERGYCSLKRVLTPLESVIEQAAVVPALNHDADTLTQLESWERHYRDEYDMAVDFSGIFIPLRRDGFKRLIVVPQGMTCNAAFAKCESLFPCWKWTDDLDAAVKGHNDRESNRDYAIWIRGGVEPDEVAMTADQTRAVGLSGTVLMEDLLIESKYFNETGGEHLNKEKITRCDGSRSSDGGVPRVCWYGGRFRVYCCFPGDPSVSLRPRSVVC